MGRLRLIVLGTVIGAFVLSSCGGGSGEQTATGVPTTGVLAPGTAAAPTATRVLTAEARALSASICTVDDWSKIMLEISGGERARAQARANEVWQALADTKRVPLVLGDQAVVFLYKGKANSVSWRGVFSRWTKTCAIEGVRAGSTDLWVGESRFPAASRVEYKLVLNDKDWILDPANDARVPSGDTVNNVLAMPGFTATDVSAPRTGTVGGTLSGNISIASRALGYTVNYRVWTPPGYAALSKLPVWYVLDGSDFVSPNVGSMPSALDNLVSEGKVHPLIAVFIDPYDPADPKNNRREDQFLAHPGEFARFVATEVVPVIDTTYRTDTRPEARTIQGVSYGGLSALFIAATYPQLFHNVAALSPSWWALERPLGVGGLDKAGGVGRMAEPIAALLRCGGETGIKCPALPLKIFVSYGVPEWDVGDLSEYVGDLQQRGYPVKGIQVSEGHAWSAFRALLDEMLVYFDGA